MYYHGAVIKEGKVDPNNKVIALSFDDGPWRKNTDSILKILKRNNVKATFFMLGDSLANFPQQGKLIADEGHAIGNHTWHHFYHRMDEQTAGKEIETTADLIYKTTNIKTTLFRPPGGIMTNCVADYAKKHNYTIVMWSADSIDYSHPSVPVIVNRVMREAKPGGIVLMHDGGGNNRSQTIAALPQIISKLKAQGYSFVTIPKLLQMQVATK
ncbi:MAG: polysaccharide deacetylase family protein [Scytonematopsis contorta HA4267-MV1]|jgi:chitin deacetylase|nr:polysaccharide deacetylase family protein [Scytonematopsis contorta HA4267-MV1]